MKHKNLYHNGTAFKFISNIGEKLGESLNQLNNMMFGVIESKPYKLDWDGIKKTYQEYKKLHGQVDIDSFSYDYVLGYALVNNLAENKVIKEAMYLHLRAELLAKEVSGELS